MRAVLDVILLLIQFATLLIFVQAVLSWLLAFNVINLGNPAVRSIWGTLQTITEPVYRPIRRILPDTGGLDLSPMVLLLGLFFLQSVIVRYGYRLAPF
jgi:YggT family protein